MPETPNKVEAAYREAIDAMTPAERVARGAAMFEWTRKCLARQIVAERKAAGEETELDPYVLKLLVALRMYENEPKICALIERRLRDVSS